MIALFSHSFGANCETFIMEHARRLAPDRTVLICYDPQGADLLGFPVLAIPRPFRTESGNFLASLRKTPSAIRRALNWYLSRSEQKKLRAFLQAHGVTGVLAEYGPMGLLMQSICAAEDIPLFVYFRGFDASAHLRNPRMRARYKRMLPKLAGVFAVSADFRDRLISIGCPPALVHVNPSGADPDRFLPTSREPDRILAVGRLVEKKAPHLTIQAFARVLKQYPDARLDIVGSGPLEPVCRDLVHALGLEHAVTLSGALDHAGVAALMSRAAIFVQHSVTARNGDTEGLPTAIVEAMSAEIPVVSTRHSGIPEAVLEGVTGLLVDEHDVEGMATAMITLLDDPARAAEMGRQGRQRVLERFTKEASHALIRRVMGIDALSPGES
jgi:colanic acid/amylovoran biosynthesis glycosyltransferase